MHQDFINYFKELDEGIVSIHGQAMSGKTVSLFNFADLYVKMNKKVLILDGDYGGENIQDLFSKKINYMSRANGLREITDFTVLDEFTKNFDVLMIDSPQLLINTDDTRNGLSSLPHRVQIAKKFYKYLVKVSEKNNCLIFLTHSIRRGMSLNQSKINVINHISMTEIEVSKESLENSNKQVLNYKITKDRVTFQLILKDFQFELDNKLKVLENPFIPKFNFFSNKINGWLSKFLNNKAQILIEDDFNYFSKTYLKISKKQSYDLWDSIIINKNILDKENCFIIKDNSANDINYNYINFLVNLKEVYKDFNFTLFQNKFKDTKFTFLVKNCSSSNETEDLFNLFLRENISFKKSLSLFKDLAELKEKESHNLEILQAIGIAYDSLIKGHDFIKTINPEYEVPDLKKSINKLKTFYKIYILLESNLRKIESIKEENRKKFFMHKMRKFSTNNINLENEQYKIKIPNNITEVIENGEIFENCTKNGFFIEKIIKDDTLLFYFISKDENHRDLCIHLNSDLSLIEIKCPNNKNINRDERISFLDLHKKITI